MARTYVFRLTAEGIRELEEDFRKLGDTGARAFDELKNRVPGLGGAYDDAKRRADEHRRSLESLATGADKVVARFGAMIGLSTSWGAALAAINRLGAEAAKQNEETAASVDRLSQAYTDLARNAGPAFTAYNDFLAGTIDRLNDVFAAGQKAAQYLGLASPPSDEPALARRVQGGGWMPGAAGFPEAGVTDLTEQRRAQEKLLSDALKYGEELAKADRERVAARIEAESDAFDKQLAEALAYGEELEKLDRDRTARRLADEEAVADKALAEALRYGEQFQEAERARVERSIAKLNEAAERSADYWRDALERMSSEGGYFFERFFATGEADLKDFLQIFRNAWARMLADLATTQFVEPLMRQALGAMSGALGLGGGGGVGGGMGGAGLLGGGLAGLFGGGGASFNAATGNWTPGPAGFGGIGAFGAGLAGLGLGQIAGMLGGNTTGGGIGGAAGAVLGNFLFPGIGGLIGGALSGGLLGGMFGGKPSNFRATATFGPGGSFELSGDKPNAQTLSLAQQAAQSIADEVNQLKAFGVEFQNQLSNIWIGARDPSSFQLVGGGRMSVGSVGDVQDLVAETVAALLKGASATNPVAAAALAGGYDQLRATAAYSAQNAPLIGSINDYLRSFQYGPGSVLAPGQQYAAALSDYERSRAAALSGGPAEAQAYLQMTSQFLPFAREYLGTTQAYETIRSGAESTLQSIVTKLQTPPGMSTEIVSPIVNATTTGFATTVESIEKLQSETVRLRESFDRLAGDMSALLRAKPV